MRHTVLVVGGGGHGRSVIDTMQRSNLYEIVGIVDRDPAAAICGYSVIGGDDDLERLRLHSDAAAIGIGFMGGRSRRHILGERLERLGYELPPIVDPSAICAQTSVLGPGTFVGKCAIVNAFANVGRFAIVNSGAVVEHDCRVGDGAHVSVHATLCGGVSVGTDAFIGAGSVVIQGVTVGAGAIIGAGSVILSNVVAGTKIVGVHHG